MNPKNSLIVPVNNGFNVTVEDKEIFFPTAELHIAGCKNCIWKIHNQCNHKEGEFKLICPEMIQFLTGLASKGDSLTEVWEKFLLYKVRLEESLNYKDYRDLESKIQEQEKHAYAQDYNLSEEDQDKLNRLKMDRNAAKLWWTRINRDAIQGLQKVADRTVKKNEGGRRPGIHSTGTINFINQEKIERGDKR